MRALLLLLCFFLSIKFIDNSQCASGVGLAGHCGCCSILEGSCIHYESIDGVDVSWHLCVPISLKKTFSLDQCRPKLIEDNKHTRICRTKNGTFRLFPQCAKKELCYLPMPPRYSTPECHTPMAVPGPCEKSQKRFTYDASRRECIPFTYSGCGGTTNRFYRQEKCVEQCIKKL